MTGIEFLAIDEAHERRLNVPDVYYGPGYARSAEILDNGTWECATDGTNSFAYIKRMVPGTDEFDLVTPYGYAGPVGAASGAQLSDFRARFHRAAVDRGLIAEFLRLHPFDHASSSAEDLRVDALREHTTFAVELVGPDAVEEYWSGAEGRHRTAVRKSEKSDVQVLERSTTDLHDPASAFRVLYAETMARVGSSDRLRLGNDYFERLRSGLGEGLRLVEAVGADGEVVAASLFMRHGDRLHYHLSGSTVDGMRVGASNAILDHAVRALLPAGGRLHLGGGVTPDDGLTRFKASLANRRLTMRLGTRIVNQTRYDELAADVGADPSGGFFPAYRSGA